MSPGAMLPNQWIGLDCPWPSAMGNRSYLEFNKMSTSTLKKPANFGGGRWRIGGGVI